MNECDYCGREILGMRECEDAEACMQRVEEAAAEGADLDPKWYYNPEEMRLR